MSKRINRSRRSDQYAGCEKRIVDLLSSSEASNFIEIKDNNERIWYAQECLKNGWSKTILIHQIE